MLKAFGSAHQLSSFADRRETWSRCAAAQTSIIENGYATQFSDQHHIRPHTPREENRLTRQATYTCVLQRDLVAMLALFGRISPQLIRDKVDVWSDVAGQ